MNNLFVSDRSSGVQPDRFAEFVTQAELTGLLGSQRQRIEPQAVEALRLYWAHHLQPFWRITRTQDQAWIAQVQAQVLQNLQRLVGGQSLASEGSSAYVAAVTRLSSIQLAAWESFIGLLPATSFGGKGLLAILSLWRSLPGLSRGPQAPAHSVRGKRQAAGLRRLRILVQETEKLPTRTQRNDTLHQLQSWIRHRRLPLRHIPAAQIRKLIQGLSRFPSINLSPHHLFQALDAFQARACEWVRPPESLTEEASKDPYELMMHCFAHYRIPRWMWEYLEYPSVFTTWAKWLMSGRDFRQAPHQEGYQLTRRMIHFLWEIADRYRDHHQVLAFLYARGIGATEAFASQTSALMRPFNGSAEVLRFLVKFESAWQAFELRAVMEYLGMRFLMAQQEGQPYSLKGRTPRSLRRDMEAFQQMILADPVLRANVERQGPYIPANWQPSGHPGARYRRGEERYQIVELTSRVALEQEGRVLAHCVAGYAHQCASGYHSIWSLRRIQGTQANPLVTIQVENRRTIVQARGYQNRQASASEMCLIHAWARKTGLLVSSQA